MDVRRDFISKVQEVKHPNDESFSHTGKSDFSPERPEIISISSGKTTGKPRTKASQNNSYT